MINNLLSLQHPKIQKITFCKAVKSLKENHNNDSDLLIAVRKAQLYDVDRIWDILHAEGNNWSKNKVIENLNNLHLLVYKDKIICVFQGVLHNEKYTLSNITVHPMYPENSVGESLKGLLLSVINRESL